MQDGGHMEYGLDGLAKNPDGPWPKMLPVERRHQRARAMIRMEQSIEALSRGSRPSATRKGQWPQEWALEI